MWPGTPRDMRLVRAYCRGSDIGDEAGAVWDAAGSGRTGTAALCHHAPVLAPAFPLYMDKHNVGEGVSIEDVARAHEADLQTRGKHDVHYLRYWVDEKQGRSSAWSRRRPRRLRQRCTGRRTAWSRTRSSRSRKAPDRLRFRWPGYGLRATPP